MKYGIHSQPEIAPEVLDLKTNEALSIIDHLFTTQNTQLIIEEPEQNLFPSTQSDLVYYLLQNGLKRDGNRITLTTYSPYVLYALNNAMMAHLVKESMPEEEYANLKCSGSSIDPKDVSIYEIRDGYVDGVIQEADGLIANNYFDEQMKELMDDFYAMLNYYGDDTE